jgi:hypothetical protein
MRRAQVFLDQETGMLSVKPGWPPLPSVGDHWVKPPSKRRFSREKHLERKVLAIKGWRLTYEDQSGVVRETTADTFRKWTDDCRAVPKKLREYVVLKPDVDGEIKLRKKKRVPKRAVDAYECRRSRERRLAREAEAVK